jgi:ribosomal silencing factor RsfS
MTYNSIDWENVSRKEARGFNDVDLAEVPEIKGDNLIIKSGAVNKEVYSILRNLVERFDVHKLLLRATREEAETLYRIEE